MARKLGVRSPLKVGGQLRAGDGPRLDRRLAARHGVGLRDARRGRHLLRADRDPQGRAAERQGGHQGGLGLAEAHAGDPRRRRVEGDPDPRGQRQLRHRRPRRRSAGPPPARPGTTDKHADAWFVGYTPDLATAVWMGYQAGEIPMENVHGIAVSGGSFPAEIWRLMMERTIGLRPVRDFAEPEGVPAVPAVPARPARAQLRPVLRRADDDTTDHGHDRRRTTDDDAGKTDAEGRRSRTSRRSTREAGRRGRGGCGRPRARRRRLRSRLAARLAARPAPRRQRLRHRPALPRAPARRLRGLPRSRCSLIRRAPPSHPRRDRARRRDPARSARGAAPPLHRRLDVLVVRLDRGARRREPVLRSAGDVSRQPCARRTWAAPGSTRRPSTGRRSRSPRSPSRSWPATPTRSPPGRTRPSPPRPPSPRRCSPGAWPGGGRSRSPSSAGTPSSRCTSRAAATTTPGSAR